MKRKGVAIGRPKRMGKPKSMRLKRKKWKNNSKNPRFGSNDSFRTRNQ